MLKLFIALLLCGTCLPIQSEENISIQNYLELYDETRILAYIGDGNEHLLSQRYQEALDDFQRATALIEKLNQDWDELKFLVSFGKAIAYDNLELHADCKQSLEDLLFLMYSPEENEQEVYPDPSINDTNAAISLLWKLAMISSSEQNREILLHIVREMSSELLPMFHLADPLSAENQEWDFDYSNENDSMELSKSFWKKLRKMLKKIPDVLQWIADILEAKKRIENATN